MHNEIGKEKLLKYLEALEAVNRHLLTALKSCLIVLAEVKASTPDEQGWQSMLDEIQNIIRAVEKVDQEKTVHYPTQGPRQLCLPMGLTRQMERMT